MSSATTSVTRSDVIPDRQSQAAKVAVWVAILLVAAGFAVLAYTAHFAAYFPVDLQVTQAVQAIPAPWFHSFMFVVSWPGFPPQADILVVVIAIGYYAIHRRREAVYLVVGGFGIATVSQGVKMLVNRPRPLPSLVHVLDPGLNGGHWSFPAGHVETDVVVLGFIFFVAYATQRPSIWRTPVLLTAAIMIALIGVSRIDSGEHWFSDVIGGYLLGALWLTAMLYFYQRGRRAATSDPVSMRRIEMQS